MVIVPRVTAFNIFNTNVYLLQQYEEIAIKIKNGAVERDYEQLDANDKPKETIVLKEDNIFRNLTLISLNAAIVEGILRQVFTAAVSKDHHTMGELAAKDPNKEQASTIFRSYTKIFNLHIELEANGSWDNLKKAIKDYTGLKVEDLMLDKNAFTAMFHLRNAIAHGTALVLPSQEIVNNEGDDYLVKWQNKLQSASMFAKTNFSTSLFEALKHPSFAEKFMDETKIFMERLSQLKIFNNDQGFLFDNIKRYTFGYRLGGDYKHKN
ncbi:hypothetical protein A3N63_21370 [Klebsiella aerogenes]|uniref:hypothetical protein n=1 Tax=Klebsiella aerogenes TaxID=548 RepID=UPI0007B3231B|nr:hypothetical protein [Klebsiella aerogenes]KZR04306.1 hypothetical protein A3N63_21370 [Klebsiella aerogenes]